VFEIGYSLRAARERQGIGLPEAELATKIRAKYIRALEEEDFDALPADTYARGFLRTYADYLGLDGEIYVDEYASRFHNAECEDEPKLARSRPRRPRRERTIERRGVILALAGIAVIAALTVGAWVYGNAPSPTTQGLVLRGIHRGTLVVVKRGSKAGRLLFRGTLKHGQVEQFSGARFYVSARIPANLNEASSAGVTVIHG
jgi:hypothetical protein